MVPLCGLWHLARPSGKYYLLEIYYHVSNVIFSIAQATGNRMIVICTYKKRWRSASWSIVLVRYVTILYCDVEPTVRNICVILTLLSHYYYSKYTV